MLRNALYGLRGVRVGEASNPGPPQPRVDVVEEILASLEHDLTHIDSDDEPLVSVVVCCVVVVVCCCVLLPNP